MYITESLCCIPETNMEKGLKKNIDIYIHTHTWMYITESLCCVPETNTAWLVNCM